LTAIPISGTEPYSFTWSNGNTGASIEDLDAGRYKVTIIDGNNCEGTAEVEISENMNIGARLDGTQSICDGVSDGQINIAPTSGEGPYEYEWDNGDNTAEIQNLDAGRYRVTVSDKNGCTGRFSFDIDELREIRVDISGPDSICAGETGMLIADGFNGRSPYTYRWSNGQRGDQLDGLDAGNYTVEVEDANGCSSSVNFEIFEKSESACMSTSTLELDNFQFTFSPNPFNDYITIRQSGLRQYKVEILTITGVKITSLNVNSDSYQLDMSQEIAGVYVARILDEDGKFLGHKKLVKVW